MTLYFSLGYDSDPTQFNHDMKFTGIGTNQVAFNSNQLSMLQNEDGWAVAIYIDAYEAISNLPLDFSIDISFMGAYIGLTASVAALVSSAALYL